MKLVKFLILGICLVFMLNFMTLPAKAILGSDEVDSQTYILNHGHSREMMRMIKHQKASIAAEGETVEKTNKFTKFWRNLYYERDLTLPLEDFGYNEIRSVEEPHKNID